ncbi:MAG: hypothetical protein AB7O38_30480, partial [Pirellulaceae bacterium]
RSGDDAASYTPAYPISLDGQTLVVGYLQNALVICELTTGRPRWRTPLSSGYDEHSAWPIYREPYLWVSGPFRGGSRLYELDPSMSPRLRTVWDRAGMSNDILSSVLVNDALYGFDVVDAQAKTHRPTRGHFRCLDFLTGDEHWSVPALADRRPYQAESPAAGSEPGRIGHASVLAADGKLILFNDTGELILARARTDRYEELARTSVLGGEIVWTPPALHRGRVYVRNQTRVACVYLGRSDWLTPDRLPRPPMRTGEIPQQVYVDWTAQVLGVEPEYAFDPPSMSWLYDWYWISLLGIFGPALLGAVIAGVVARGHSRRRIAAATAQGLLFVLGAAGTSLFSRWRGDFVFTWHVCLFAAFQFALLSLPRRHSEESDGPRRFAAVLTLALFVATCFAYYLACRRFSLVFEWVFLAGFGAALPCLLAQRWLLRHPSGWRFAIASPACCVAGYTLFYWSSAAVLWLRTG